MAPEDIQETEENTVQETSGFQFINQTGSKIKDPAIRKLVRQNAISRKDSHHCRLLHLGRSSKRALYPQNSLNESVSWEMLTHALLDVSKAREKERVRPTQVRPLVRGLQSYIGEGSGSDAGSDIIEDPHPLKVNVSQLDDYWSSERDPAGGTLQPPTTAFSPAQLLALAESTAGFDELNIDQQSSVTSPTESSTSFGEHKSSPSEPSQTRPRRTRFQRGCRTCRSVVNLPRV